MSTPSSNIPSHVTLSNRYLQWALVALSLVAFGEAAALHRLGTQLAFRTAQMQTTRLVDGSNVVENWFRLARAHGQISVSVDAQTGKATCRVVPDIPGGERGFAGYGESEPIACENAVLQMEQRFPDRAAAAVAQQPGGI